MTTLIEAARQALEALEELDQAWPLPVGKKAKAAITALRAAIEREEAEQAKRAEPQAQAGEPKVFIYAHELLANGGGIWLGCKSESAIRAAHDEGETGDEVVALITLQSHREAMAKFRAEVEHLGDDYLALNRSAAFLREALAKKDAALKACVSLSANFEISGPDADGLVWLVLHGNGTTGKAMFNLGSIDRIAAQTAMHLEQDRRAAITQGQEASK